MAVAQEEDFSFSDHVESDTRSRQRALDAIRSRCTSEENLATLHSALAKEDETERANQTESELETASKDLTQEYQRLIITNLSSEEEDSDTVQAKKSLQQAYRLREKWLSRSGKDHTTVENGENIPVLEGHQNGLIARNTQKESEESGLQPAFISPFDVDETFDRPAQPPLLEMHFGVMHEASESNEVHEKTRE